MGCPAWAVCRVLVYKRILVPIDGSDCANAGLREVPRIASQPEHMVLLIHVIEQSGWNEQFHPGTVGEIIQDTLRRRVATYWMQRKALFRPRASHVKASWWTCTINEHPRSS